MFIFWENPDNIFVLYVLYPICILLLYAVVASVVIKILIGRTPKCKSRVRLFGKTAIVTGSNAGIGKETALDFARRGARVILACRNESRGRTAAKEITESTGNYSVEYKHLNLSDLDSVRKFAEDINRSEPRLDILVNNAGISGAAYLQEGKKTVQNFDLVFGTNYVGHFLLTYLLLDLLKLSSHARIVNVSSFLHKFVWQPLNCDQQPNTPGINYPYLYGYSVSKLATVMHARELSKRLKGTGVTINSLHPGIINSQIWIPFQHILPAWLYEIYICFLKNLCLNNEAGAQTSIYVSVDEEIQSVTGEYFVKNSKASVNKLALDDESCVKLWDRSLDMCGLHIEH